MGGAQKLEDESFMLACLKMARAYVGIIEGELRLYRQKPGHKPLSHDFQLLLQKIDKRIRLHKAELDGTRTTTVATAASSQPAQLPIKKKIKRCKECGGTKKTGHQRLCSVVLGEAGIKVKKPKQVDKEKFALHTEKIPTAKKRGILKKRHVG